MIYSSSHIILVATLCGTLFLAGCGKGAPKAKGAPGGAGDPPPVSVAPVTKRVVQEFDEFSARLEATDSHTVVSNMRRQIPSVPLKKRGTLVIAKVVRRVFVPLLAPRR